MSQAKTIQLLMMVKNKNKTLIEEMKKDSCLFMSIVFTLISEK